MPLSFLHGNSVELTKLRGIMDYELGIMDVLAKSAMYQKGKVITLKKIAPEEARRKKELPIENIVSFVLL